MDPSEAAGDMDVVTYGSADNGSAGALDMHRNRLTRDSLSVAPDDFPPTGAHEAAAD
jgi:hypothetical protein